MRGTSRLSVVCVVGHACSAAASVVVPCCMCRLFDSSNASSTRAASCFYLTRAWRLHRASSSCVVRRALDPGPARCTEWQPTLVCPFTDSATPTATAHPRATVKLATSGVCVWPDLPATECARSEEDGPWGRRVRGDVGQRLPRLSSSRSYRHDGLPVCVEGVHRLLLVLNHLTFSTARVPMPDMSHRMMAVSCVALALFGDRDKRCAMLDVPCHVHVYCSEHYFSKNTFILNDLGFDPHRHGRSNKKLKSTGSSTTAVALSETLRSGGLVPRVRVPLPHSRAVYMHIRLSCEAASVQTAGLVAL